MVGCSVVFCKRRSETSNLSKNGVSYHTFPKDPLLIKEWTKFCNRKDKWIPTRTSVICSDHFTSDCFQEISNNRRILVEGAVPTKRSCSCSEVISHIKKNEKDNLAKAVQRPKASKIVESSEMKKIKIELVNKTKKIKRLQSKYRYLRNKMDSLKNGTTCSSEVSKEKSIGKKTSNDLTLMEQIEFNLKERLKTMNEKQDETALSTEFGLAECRTCLQPLDANSVLVDLFQCWVPPWDGMESTIAEDLAKLANVQITPTDRYSKVICEPCCLKLQSACDFASSARKNDRVLRQRYPPFPEETDYSNNTIWPKPIQLDKNINGTVYENVMDVEIKQEVMSEDEYTNNMLEESRDNPLESLEIKIEPEELIHPMPSILPVIEQEENLQNNGEALPYVSLNGYSIQNTDENTPELNGIDSKENILQIKQEPICEEDEEATSTDLSLECMLCSKVFHSVSGLKAHVIAQHSYKSVKRKADSNSPERKQKNHEYVCETCQRKFTTSTDLMVHETCHNKSVCYACSAKFDTFEQLTKHSRRCKAIASKEVQKPKTLEDVKRPVFSEPLPVNSTNRRKSKEKFRCSQCGEEFNDNYYLTIHEEVHHSVNSDQVKCKEEDSESAELGSDNLKCIFGSD